MAEPSEFLVDGDGKVLFSGYSSGPLARLDAPEVVEVVKFYESKKK